MSIKRHEGKIEIEIIMMFSCVFKEHFRNSI